MDGGSAGGSAGGSDCSHDPGSCTNPFIYVHAVIMVLCALVGIPAAVLVLHLRSTLPQVRRLHERIQLACALFLVVGLACAIKFTVDSNSGHFMSTHGRLSLSVLVIIAAQVALAFIQRAVRRRSCMERRKVAGLSKLTINEGSESASDLSVADISTTLLDSNERKLAADEQCMAPFKRRLFVLDALHRGLGYVLLVMLFASAITGLISYSSHCVAEMHMDPPTSNTIGSLAKGATSGFASASSSGSGGMAMAMGVYLQFSYQDVALMFNGWVLNYSSIYFGTLVVSFYIAFVVEVLKIAPTVIEQRITAAFKQRLAAPQAACHEEPLPWAVTVVARGVAVLSVGLRALLGFLMMYLLMTYNIGVVAALVTGVCLSFLVLPKPSSGDSDDCM